MSGADGLGVGSGLALDAVRARFALTRDDLWVLYMALGGVLGVDAVAAYLSGSGTANAVEHNTMALALNEYALDAGQNHPVAYMDITG